VKSKSWFVRLCAAGSMAIVSAAAASDGKVLDKPVEADTPAAFATVAATIRGDMRDGGRYEFIRPDDKAKVGADLDEMATMLQKSGTVAAMSQSDKVRLFNIQEHVNGILTHSDRNRLVCEHRPPMGSNIPLTSCKTIAEVEKARRDSQKMSMDQNSNGFKCVGMRPGSGCAAGPSGGN
jgi:hypothetical protein